MPSKELKPVPQSVRLPDSLKKEIKRAARITGISQQDVIRLGLAKGLPILLAPSPAPAAT